MTHFSGSEICGHNVEFGLPVARGIFGVLRAHEDEASVMETGQVWDRLVPSFRPQTSMTW